MVQTVQTFLSVILSCANLIVLGYALYKFTKRPHDTLEQRISTCEVEIRNIKESLNSGQDKFRAQDEAIRVLIHSTLALVEFEMQYCLLEHKDMSDSLVKAKDDLHSFLAKK